MKILAVDYGLKRVGLALSDPMGILGSPYKTIPYVNDEKLLQDVLDVQELVCAERILVGVPVRTDGSFGVEARRVLEFAYALEKAVTVPVTWRDEAFTTAEAQSRLKSRAGKRRDPRRERETIDQLAACVLLEEYLRSIPSIPEPLPSLPPLPPPPASDEGTSSI